MGRRNWSLSLVQRNDHWQTQTHLVFRCVWPCLATRTYLAVRAIGSKTTRKVSLHETWLHRRTQRLRSQPHSRAERPWVRPWLPPPLKTGCAWRRWSRGAVSRTSRRNHCRASNRSSNCSSRSKGSCKRNYALTNGVSRWRWLGDVLVWAPPLGTARCCRFVAHPSRP